MIGRIATRSRCASSTYKQSAKRMQRPISAFQTPYTSNPTSIHIVWTKSEHDSLFASTHIPRVSNMTGLMIRHSYHVWLWPIKSQLDRFETNVMLDYIYSKTSFDSIVIDTNRLASTG